MTKQFTNFPQIPAISHIVAETICKGELTMLYGDGEFGEGMDEPFFMRCEKCGEERFYSPESAQLGCPMILRSKEELLPNFNKLPMATITDKEYIDNILKRLREDERASLHYKEYESLEEYLYELLDNNESILEGLIWALEIALEK